MPGMVFSQIVCLFVSLYIPLFFKTLKLLVWYFEGSFKGIILAMSMHKVVFKAVTLSRGSILSYFFYIFVYCYSFMFLVSLFFGDHAIASHSSFADAIGITRRFTSLEKSFQALLSNAVILDLIWVYSSMSFRNLKLSFDILHEYLDITVVVTKL